MTDCLAQMSIMFNNMIAQANCGLALSLALLLLRSSVVNTRYIGAASCKAPVLNCQANRNVRRSILKGFGIGAQKEGLYPPCRVSRATRAIEA